MQWGVIFWVLSIIKSQKMYSMVTFSLDDMMKYQDCDSTWTALDFPTHRAPLYFWSKWQILQYYVLFRWIWFQFCPTYYQWIPLLIAYCLFQCPLQRNLVPVLPNWLPIDPLPDWWSVLTPETTILQTSLFRWIIMLLLSSITDVSVFRRFWSVYLRTIFALLLILWQ